ncbi:hypothetical protein HMPREF3038_02896 [Akkermansia sp. KLE1797]|nr:hypothetical protein HMPREF3038_02896 [Akkermansia sp. KLE1797]
MKAMCLHLFLYPCLRGFLYLPEPAGSGRYFFLIIGRCDFS